MPMPPRPADQLLSKDWGELGRIVQSFEEACERGEWPEIAGLLSAGADAEERHAILVELIHTDLECRTKAGQAVRAESYLERFPELAGNHETVLDLLAAEYRLRRRREPDLTPEEYRVRFPHLAVQLPQWLNDTPPPGADTLSAARRLTALEPDKPPPLVSLGTAAGYEVLEFLGRGGMGAVYKARQLRLNRVVALKVLLGGHAGREEGERFHREAEAAGALQHANIVQIYEVGEHEGMPYFVLEYVEGGSLAQRLAVAPLPPLPAAELAETLARTMHAAHQRGIIHRDLKPANVLLTSDGVPKIADFGLAKQLNVETGHTISGTLVGTPCYMSPEQAQGLTHAIGPAADVYALGAILYEMLTGRPPFRAATVLDTLRQAVSEDPVPPSRLQPKVPRDLETICLKCLEIEPGKRYGSADELARDLRRFQNGEGVLARRAFVWERGLKWARRRPLVAGLTAALLLVLAGSFLGMAWLWLRAEFQREEADRQRTAAEESEQLAEDRLVRLEVATGMRLVDEGDLFAALPWFAKAFEKASQDPQQLTIHRMRLGAVLRQCPRLVQLWGHSKPVSCAAFSPDGRRVLTGCDDGTAQLWDMASGKRAALSLRHTQAVVHAAFSPSGRYVVTASWDQTARIWDTVTDKQVSLPHERAVAHAAFSRDGRRVVTASGDRKARIWDVGAGAVSAPLELVHEDEVSWAEFSPDGEHVLTACHKKAHVWKIGPAARESLRVLDHNGPVQQVVCSPDGRYAVSTAGKTAHVWAPSAGKHLFPPLEHSGAVVFAAISHDSRLLAIAADDGTVRLSETAVGRLLASPRGHEGAVLHAVFSPDGSRLATAGEDGTARVWDTATGLPLSPPLKHNKLVARAAFHPDGFQLVTASHDRTARVWDIASNRPGGVSLKHPPEVWHVAFSPDGSRLAAAGKDNLARIWDTSTGKLAAALDHTESVMCVAFSPDGRWIVTAGQDDAARLWDASQDKPVPRRLEHGETVAHAAFSQDSRRVITASYDRTARVWDAATGAQIAKLEHRGLVAFASLSPDGRLAVTCSNDGTAQLWHADSGKAALDSPLMHDGPAVYAAFSPDGQLVATASTDRRARVWHTATGKLAFPALEHHDEVRRVAFSPDGKCLASASNDRTARVWDAASGKPIAPPLRHGKEVRHVAFSPEGRRIISTGDDGIAQVWDAATGQPVTPPLKHQGPVLHAVFSPDGNWAATASADGTARLWNVAPDSRPAEELLLLTRLLAGVRLDEANGVVLLEAEELEQAWETLRSMER